MKDRKPDGTARADGDGECGNNSVAASGASDESPDSTLGIDESGKRSDRERSINRVSQLWRDFDAGIGSPGGWEDDFVCTSRGFGTRKGATRIKRLSARPSVRFLAQHVKGDLEVPGGDRIQSVTIDVLTVTSLGVTSIL